MVAPLTNAGAPLVTAVLSLIFAGVVPGPLKIVGLILALIASLLLVLEPERGPDRDRTSLACTSCSTSSPATNRDTPSA